MEDYGEKIVFLARELLESDLAIPPEPVHPPKISLSFKALCMTAFLAAAGGGLVSTWANKGSAPLNIYEKTEIQALIFYAAQIKGVKEEDLRHEIERTMGIPHLEDLTTGQFPIAQRYLQKLAQKDK